MGRGVRRWMVAAVAFLLVALPGSSRATELRVLSSQGVKTVIDSVAAAYEAQSGNHLSVSYDTSTRIKTAVEAGTPFDVVVVTPPMIDDLVKQGKVAPGTATTLARVGLGIAVKKGAPHPDISTAASFKQALLAAPSIVYSTSGASSVVLMHVLDKLGIAETVKAKVKTIPNGLTGDVVARGDAALAVQLIPELKSVAGVDVVGPFPPDLQDYVVLTAAVAASADRRLAEGFIAFLGTSAVGAIFRAKGMEPG